MEKNVKIGFIGAGKMASAIIKGLIKTGFAQPENVMATQAELDSLKEKSDYLGIKVISDNKINIYGKINITDLVTDLSILDCKISDFHEKETSFKTTKNLTVIKEKVYTPNGTIL